MRVILFWWTFWGLKPGIEHLRYSRESVMKRQGEEQEYMGVFALKEWVVRISRLLLIKENFINQVRECRTFPHMGRCSSLGALIIPWIGISSSGSVSSAFSSWISSGCPIQDLCIRWLLNGWYFLFPSCVPSGLTIKVAVMWLMAATSFVYSHGRQYFSSQKSTNIWQTFHEQFLSYSNRKFIPDQVK